MHLKAYSVDGEVLRSGSANFSTSGERAQDNDLIVIRNEGVAAKFDAHFERMWDGAQPMIEFGPAIHALEPRYGWLQRVADAILRRVPGKVGRHDTATRMMRDADFTKHGVRPAERNRYNAGPEIDPMVELERIVSADDGASSDVPPPVPRVAGDARGIRSSGSKPSRG